MFKGALPAKDRLKRLRQREGLYFVLPALIYMLMMVGYPIIYNILLSFQNVSSRNVNGIHDWVGFSNYLKIFAAENFRAALSNTIRFTLISISFQFIFGLALALFFNKHFPCAKFIRGLLVVSYLLPNVVSALLWKYMLSPDAGIIDKVLIALGILQKPVGWLQNIDTALWGPIFANIWTQTPLIMLLLNTGLSNIPADTLECSQLDGANAVQRFFYIILPLLKNSILAVMMVGFMYTFKVFDLIFTMTGGGPVYATEVLSTYSYKLSFNNFKFSQGAAAANVLFLCLFIVSFIYRHFLNKEE